MDFYSNNDQEIVNWIALFRKAGYDVKHVGKSPHRELTRLEKHYLGMDLEFLKRIPVENLSKSDAELV